MYSVYLENSNNNIIRGCGINASLRFIPRNNLTNIGICLKNSSYNSIMFNVISYASDEAILMTNSTNNTVEACGLAENDRGIAIINSDFNVIHNCSFYNNSNEGIRIDSASTRNHIYYNNFVENGEFHGEFIQAYDGGFENKWYNDGLPPGWNGPSPSVGKGNYWSDYTGEDSNGDGIGDVPYLVPGSAGSEDMFPLMEPIDY